MKKKSFKYASDIIKAFSTTFTEMARKLFRKPYEYVKNFSLL